MKLLLTLTDCKKYVEDPFITFDAGESKGQCTCGYKWFEHNLEALPEEEKESAANIQKGQEKSKYRLE